MKSFLFSLFLFLTTTVFAQTLYTNSGAIPFTQNTMTLLAGKTRGAVQWQCSADGQEWMNIEEQKSDSLVIAASDEGFYRAEIVDGDCHVVYSDTAFVTKKSTNETGVFVDRRDSRAYKWVKIGNQVWMAENLAYLPVVSPSLEGSQTVPHYYVYGYQGTNAASAKMSTYYQSHGALYNLPAALEACPSGWHLPTKAEWETLAATLGGKSSAGFKMKSVDGWGSSTIGGSNSSGFSAIATGARASTNSWTDAFSANWWSKPDDEQGGVIGWTLFPNASSLDTHTPDRSNGYSIRCVKDTINIWTLTVTVPESVDPADVTLSFPTLKYNKKMATSWTIDDNVNIWELFCLINHKPLSGWSETYHSWSPKTGNPYSKPLEYTDGAGVRHRFALTTALFADYMNYMNKPENEPWKNTWTWSAPEDLRIMQDFGITTGFHNLKPLAGESTFNEMIETNGAVFKQVLGRFPKVMIEPDGNHSYISSSNVNPRIALTTAQDYVVSYIKPFAPGFTMDKNSICVRRDFVYSNLVPDLMNAYAAQMTTTNDASKIVYVGGDHAPSDTYEGLYFKQMEALYGASGNDAIWFTSLDEFYEYWYLRTNMGVTKTVKGKQVTFRFDPPKTDNFFFNSFSVLLSGISDTTGVSVSTPDNCSGTSYTMSEGKLLVNMDFDPELLTKTEKYLDKFKATSNTYDLEDARYFIQQLKPGVKEYYEKQIKEYISAPTLKKISINAGADTTSSQSVTVVPTYSGAATHYMISEDPAFSGASWKTMVANLPFSVTSTRAVHTVYVKLKNSFGESSVASASIFYEKMPFVLNSVIINNGDSCTSKSTVNVTLSTSGEAPTHYMLSEKPLFGDAVWTPYTSNVIPFKISSTLGVKVVYAKVKNASEEIKTPKFDKILLTTPVSLTSVSIDSGAIKTIKQTVNIDFAYKGIPTHYMLSENANFTGATWTAFKTPVSFTLSSEFGMKKIYAKLKDVDGVSGIATDSIELKKTSPVGRKIVISPVGFNYEYATPKLADNTTINLCPVTQLEDVDNYILKDVNGEKWATRVAKPSQLPEAMSLVLESMSGYRGSALTGNKGVYPDEYLKKYYGITSDVELLAKDGTGFKRGLRFQIEEGTYTVNVLFSTCDQATNDAQANVVYQANGVTASPSGMPLNNATKFVELKNVVVGADGILDFYLGQKTAVFAGFSLIEIIKSK